ncbi:MAG: polysaccharide biosynthesis C-terminal domain-containing protein, partial [Chloroflexi bacterium]|nr:polysaccharide biosynthesis C-terminal domain-containing protein [Chloroflexota bacterium]
QWRLTPVFLIATLFNVGLNLALVPMWGFVAAAATTIGSEVVLLAGLGWILRRDRLLSRVLEPGARPAVAAAVAAVVAVLLRDLSWIGSALAAKSAYVVLLADIGGLRHAA